MNDKITKTIIGMTESELLLLCDPISVVNTNTEKPYWTSELYSFGRYIREYALYPDRLPLIMYSDHGGPVGNDNPAPHEINTDAPVFFSFSATKARNYKKITNKKAYVLYSPNVFYRKRYKIHKKRDAEGTIAFFAHSTPEIDDLSDAEEYALALKKLPGIYQPVSVCLHMHDVNKMLYKIFFKHNIPVYTAGNSWDYRFIERFYDILRHYKYSTSSIIGSYTYYSIEMDIPFFIYGEQPVYYNKGDQNVSLDYYDHYGNNPFYKELHNELLFSPEKVVYIDQKLKQKINKQLGLYDGVSRIKMSLILYRSFLSWRIRRFLR